ncbi:MAG: hypothetical protein WCL05_07335 [Verrucomicrobiota bacterium]
MRLILVISLLMISGCSLWSGKPSADLPKQPDAPTDSKNLSTLGDEIDKSENRVAASLVAIERNADKPAVVTAEAKLGQAYLARPSEGDIAFALARASANDPAAYARQAEYGKRLLAAVDSKWYKLEADQKEALRVSALKDQRIVELTAEVERVKKDMASQMWTMAAVGTAVIGALAMAFAGPKIGISLLASGAAIGAFPFVVESKYFGIIAGTTLALAAGLGIYWLWDHVRDSANAPYEPPQK